MITVTFVENDTVRRATIEHPMKLSRLLKHEHVHLDLPCGGNKTCGKCKVRVTGHLSLMSDIEEKFLTKEELASDYRLACHTDVLGDVTVYPSNDESDILSTVTLNRAFVPSEGYGLAIDIGTTTVAMQLYDLSSGQLLEESLRANVQGAYGADVISRIHYAMDNGHTVLQNSIQEQLIEMAAECKDQAKVTNIHKVVIAGHTVMLHFYEGLDTSGIAVAPFTPFSFFGKESVFKLCDNKPYLPSCMSAYVGADITCSVLAADMIRHSDRIELLVDLGTNGELVVNHYGRLYCASTAAGPAFEGANLTHGMRGGKGAISKLTVVDASLQVETIGGVATGICGSGVLDAVSVMLTEKIIDETGRIDENYKGYGQIIDYDGDVAWRIPGTSVVITQKDIRQVQLAKSAICAGIQTLIEEVGITVEDIESFYVAGGFGYHMNKFSASNIGLFPKGLEEQTQIIGNGALSGAIALLLDKEAKIDERAIIESAKEIVLSGNKSFSDYYIDGMLFEPLGD